MKILYDDKPIVALSSGTSNSALAVIRISGLENISLLDHFFTLDLSALKPNTANFCKLLDGDRVVDEIVLTFFKGPNSYNGENILELSVHGNQLNVARIISQFVRNGNCRLAEPGEFTYRALKNKKLTLSQVEGLDLLLNAKSDLMLDQGLATLSGSLHREFLGLQHVFLKLKAAVELSIDFLEDIGEENSQKLFNESFELFNSHICSLYKRSQGNLSQLMSPSVVLLGQTNAGKSSLFNEFLNNNRSIVSAIAGTTRDYVSEYLSIDGINFRLVDTAGIREADDAIEFIGIGRTFEQISDSFFSVLVINPFETDSASLQSLDASVDYIVVTHSDVEGVVEKYEAFKSLLPSVPVLFCSLTDGEYGPIEPAVLSGPIEPNFESGPVGPKNKSGPIEPVLKNGPIEPVLKNGPIEPKIEGGPIEPVGIGALINTLQDAVGSKYRSISQDDPILIERHRASIGSAYHKTVEFQELRSSEGDIAILSSELNLIGSDISQLIGIITVDEVLSSIFSNFCIGK